MEEYKIALLVESTERYLKVLDYEFKRWKRGQVFQRIVSHSLRQYSDGNWGVCIVGSVNETKAICQSGQCSCTSPLMDRTRR